MSLDIECRNHYHGNSANAWIGPDCTCCCYLHDFANAAEPAFALCILEYRHEGSDANVSDVHPIAPIQCISRMTTTRAVRAVSGQDFAALPD